MIIFKLAKKNSILHEIVNDVLKLWNMPNIKLLMEKTIVRQKESKTLIKIEWGTVLNNINVVFIDGNFVKKNIYMDFVEGGNDMVYNVKAYSEDRKFIPKNEIWIDASINIVGIPYILVHELYERYLMYKNKKSNTKSQFHELYNNSHDKSLIIEKQLRDKKFFEI